MRPVWPNASPDVKPGNQSLAKRPGRCGVEQGPDELSDRTMEDMGAGSEEGARARLEDERREQREGRKGQSGEPDPVDEGSEESFPASDPPSGTIPVQ